MEVTQPVEVDPAFALRVRGGLTGTLRRPDPLRSSPTTETSDRVGNDVVREVVPATTRYGACVVSSAESDIRPSWRGWMHAAAFVVTVPAGIFLIMASDTTGGRTSAAIYSLSLAMMFGTSAAYHRLARSASARLVMQRLDHAGIFLLIAGTYVPITMVMFPPKWGIPVMAIIAGAALVGVVLKLAAFDRAKVAGYLLYPLMGWAAVATLPVLIDRLSATQLALVIAGGVVYSLGIPVLMFRRPDPWPTKFGYHEIWHGFVTVAAALHFIAVASMVA